MSPRSSHSLARAVSADETLDPTSSSDLSQPDTEPLPFDEEEEEEEGEVEVDVDVDGQDQDIEIDEDEEMVDGSTQQPSQQDPVIDTKQATSLSPSSSPTPSNASSNSPDRKTKQQQDQNQDEEEEELDQALMADGDGGKDPDSNVGASTTQQQQASNQSSPLKAGFTADEFSGESDLTDEDSGSEAGANRAGGRAAKGRGGSAGVRPTLSGPDEEEEEDDEEDEEEEDEDEEGMDDTQRVQPRERVEGEEEDEEEDRSSRASSTSPYDSDPNSNSRSKNGVRRGTRTRAPVVTRGRSSKNRRSSGRSSGGDVTSTAPTGATTTATTSTTNTKASNPRGRGRGRGRGSRGRGRGARGGVSAGAASTREGTATDQQDTDMEANGDEEDLEGDLEMEDGKAGDHGEATGLDGLAALATASSTNNNNISSKVRGKSRGLSSSGMGLLANAPQISVMEPEDPQSARTSREASPVLDGADTEAEAEGEENDEGIRKMRASKDGTSNLATDRGSLNPNSGIASGNVTANDTPALGSSVQVLEIEDAGLADSDLAAQHKQEALEQMTKIEIMFAKLRDRLYVERMEEARKEAEMVLEG